MKRHEWHSAMVGVFGLAMLFAFQNCSTPQSLKQEKITFKNDKVVTFLKARCVVREESDYNEPSIPNFNEEIFDQYDVYYNDADCDSRTDAMLVNFDDQEVVITCFNYQDYGFGNCYPQTTAAFICSEVDSDCGIELKSNDIPVLDDIYLQQPPRGAASN